MSTKEYSVYKNDDSKYIDFSDLITDLNGIYSIELIAINDLQYNKSRTNALESCELRFSIFSDFLQDENAKKTLIPKKKKNKVDISLCDNHYTFKNNKIIISDKNPIILFDYKNYDYLSCSLVFWITGKFNSDNESGFLNIENDGILREWYDHDKLHIEYNFQNGKKHGIQKRWYTTGQLDIMYFYTNGKLHGEQKRWYKNGKIKFITNYNFDKLNGIFKEWHPNGQIKEIKTFKDDILVEVLESYNEKGQAN